MKWLIIVFTFFLAIMTAQAITLENITLTTTTTNASLSFDRAVNVSSIDFGSTELVLINFSFSDGQNFTDSSNNYVSSTSSLTWSESNSLVDSLNFLHYFRFNVSGFLITNWSFNGFDTVSDELVVMFDGLGEEGSKSWLFQKFGYVQSYFNFTNNQSTYNNLTFEAQQAEMQITIRDKTTLEIINNVTFNLELVGGTGIITDTNNSGQINISDLLFVAGDYRLITSSGDYYTEDTFFTFTNEEILALDIYVTNISEPNAGLVTIAVVDGLGQSIPSAIVQALQWDGDTSQFILVSSGQTGLDGKATMNIILEDKVYIFRATSNGLTADSPETRLTIAENGKTITIPLASTIGERDYLFRSLIMDIQEISYVDNISTIQFDWVDQNGISQTICLNTYRTIGLTEKRLSTSCTSGVSGSYLQAFNINTSLNINIKAEVKVGDTYYPQKSFNYASDSSLPSIISYLKFEFVVIPMLFLMSIALAIKLQHLPLGFFMLAISSGVSLYLVPSLITGGIVVFLDFVAILMIWGAVGGKK